VIGNCHAVFLTHFLVGLSGFCKIVLSLFHVDLMQPVQTKHSEKVGLEIFQLGVCSTQLRLCLIDSFGRTMDRLLSLEVPAAASDVGSEPGSSRCVSSTERARPEAIEAALDHAVTVNALVAE